MRTAKLTERQVAVLRLCVRDESTNEGAVLEELWPHLRRPRLVLNALLDFGLVELDEWVDQEIGYEFKPTDAGRELVRSGGAA